MWDGKAIQEVKGYLQKKKNSNRYCLNRWQKRWFVMDGITLNWWECSEHEEIQKPLGSAIMADAILASDSNPAALSSDIVLISSPTVTLSICAPDHRWTFTPPDGFEACGPP